MYWIFFPTDLDIYLQQLWCPASDENEHYDPDEKGILLKSGAVPAAVSLVPQNSGRCFFNPRHCPDNSGAGRPEKVR